MISFTIICITLQQRTAVSEILAEQAINAKRIEDFKYVKIFLLREI
jgi:predicted restriction endonuclease